MQYDTYLYKKLWKATCLCNHIYTHTYAFTQKNVTKGTDQIKVFRAKWTRVCILEITLFNYSVLSNWTISYPIAVLWSWHNSHLRHSEKGFSVPQMLNLLHLYWPQSAVLKCHVTECAKLHCLSAPHQLRAL